jgi:hypothetical protein
LTKFEMSIKNSKKIGWWWVSQVVAAQVVASQVVAAQVVPAGARMVVGAADRCVAVCGSRG